MGAAKHKRGRCNCNRVETLHKVGCAALTPVPKTRTFILNVDQAFADVLIEYHERVKTAEPSLGAFIVRMIQGGLDVFITKIEEAAKRDRIVVLATPGDIASGQKLRDARWE